MRGDQSWQHRNHASASYPQLRVLAVATALLVAGSGGLHAEGFDFQAPDWGSGFSSCGGVRAPISFRAAGPDSKVHINGVITCRDDGEAFVYALDYINFLLDPSAGWSSASLQWIGAAAQRQSAQGRNDWFYDEAKPISVQMTAPGKRVAISNISFRVPKGVLKQARGFGFYAVGGGIFWPVLLQSRIEAAPVARAAPAVAGAPLTMAPLTPQSAAVEKSDSAGVRSENVSVPIERADWGAGFPTCAGARNPVPLKAATLNNDTLLANGIITCTDGGDAFVYAVDYLNLSLAPASRLASAKLQWFGCGAQRAGNGGLNEWIFDEALPISAEVRAGVERVSIAQLSCRVPKTILTRARGFGFYVVGGRTLWSILLL